MNRPRVAFFAPLKAPSHPTPSGDREIARLTLRALKGAGFDPFIASELRLYDRAGDAAVQARLAEAPEAEIARLDGTRMDLWFTYHCYYKAPDLVGPVVAARAGVPYAISEPSISPRRREGAWAAFAEASERAIGAADRLFWTTGRDRPALEAAGLAGRMVHLPAFLDPGAAPVQRGAGDPLRLLTVAMMRDGDKLESYRRLAAALAMLDGVAWTLDVHGDGPVRGEVEGLLVNLPGAVRFHGTSDTDAVRQACEQADVFVWPGVGEGVGMVYLEAQAAGVPVVAEDHAAQKETVFGARVPTGDAAAFARAICAVAADRQRLGVQARAGIEARHSLTAASATLARELGSLL